MPCVFCDMTREEKFMLEAFKCAKKAKKLGEVPIGAVIVKDDKIISKGYNLREKRKSTTAHAEIIAIERACKKLNDWRLDGCEIFVTLEPCPMCAGAIFNSRISRIIYAAKDEKAGACGSVFNLFAMQMDTQTLVKSGVMQDKAGKMLQSFFKDLREKDKEK